MIAFDDESTTVDGKSGRGKNAPSMCISMLRDVSCHSRAGLAIRSCQSRSSYDTYRVYITRVIEGSRLTGDNASDPCCFHGFVFCRDGKLVVGSRYL